MRVRHRATIDDLILRSGAAASRRMGRGITGRESTFSRLLSPEFYISLPLRKRRGGAGKTGWPLHPGPSRKRNLRERVDHRYRRIHSGLPCAVVYGLLRALVSAKSARMCERAVDQNRPSLGLSPIALKGLGACRGARDRSGVFLNPNSCTGFEPEPSKEGNG
jgi:hypothetical protein